MSGLVEVALSVASGGPRAIQGKRRFMSGLREASNVATIYAPFTGANKRTPGSTQVSLMRKVRRSIQ
jgi:hypothetical protein